MLDHAVDGLRSLRIATHADHDAHQKISNRGSLRVTGERPHCDQPVASRMGRASGLEGFEQQIQGLRSADAAQALEAALTIFRSLAAQQGLRDVDAETPLQTE